MKVDLTPSTSHRADSPREKLAQLIFVRIGSNLPPVRTVEEDEERVARLLEECPVGGLLLFNGGPETKAALARLQQVAQSPLLVAADIERGVGQQVREHTLFPHAMAFDQLGQTAMAAVADFARCLAREARDVGIHVAFGPVADVNTNPRNPIIATRAFSESPARAAELTRAFVAAAETAGLLTTAKHFPGHGSTYQDSHDSLPVVDRSRAELEACELAPFRAAIDAGCALVMTAHVAYPAIDPSGTPATLSAPILQDLLRKHLQFRGVICSDSLLMAGVRERCANEGEMALATLKAGVDLLLDLEDPRGVVDYLCACVAAGRLEQPTIDAAFQRVQRLKAKAFASVLAGAPTDTTNPLDGKSLSQQIARAAITVVAGDGSILPFDAAKPLGAILLKPFETHLDPPEQALAAALRERFRHVTYMQLGAASGATEYERAAALARQAPQLLVAIVVRPAAWHAFGLRPEQRVFVEQALGARTDTVFASLGVPYAVRDFPTTAIQICTFSDVPASQLALADRLLTAGRRTLKTPPNCH